MTHFRAMIGLTALLAAFAPPSKSTAANNSPIRRLPRRRCKVNGGPRRTLNSTIGAALVRLVQGGTVQPWDAILGINGISLTRGERYRLSIVVSGDPDGPMRAIAQKGAEPWTAEGEITRR
jgi:endoglucanase